ncbi:MAG: hypothetical protein ACYC69_02600 [Thermodesulfovibrionales bacterium]
MSKCIYCNEREADSDEHAIPACLGMDDIRNFELLKDKLCRDCNSRIGALEEQFCRCSPEGFMRRVVGIKGRKHHAKTNPFYQRSSGTGPMEAETEHPSLDCMLLCEFKEGTKDFFPARQIIVRDKDGGHHPILITERIRSSEDFIKVLEDKGLPGAVPVEFHSNPEEHEWLSGICKGLPNFSEFTELTPVQPQSDKEVRVTIFTTEKYFRAIAKIAFHHFLQHFPQFSGAEKEFDGIRKFIMEGGKRSDWVTMIPGSFIYDLKDPHIFINKYVHVIATEKNYMNIVSKMLFFDGPERKPPSYFLVKIGRNPERIICPQRVGHQIVYFEQKDKDGFIGIMQEMKSISQSFL